jgi:putative ABC transport system permease protein
LGIGANTAVFTLLNSVLLQPLRHPSPEQLMHFDHLLSVREYLEFREINRSFEEVGAYTRGIDAYTTSEVNLTAGDQPLRVRSISVDASLLRTLAISPAQGRLFTAEETRFGMGGLAQPVAILSHELWQTAFQSRPVVGHMTSIGGRMHEIVGVMPPGLDLMDHRPAVWLPVGGPAAIRDNRSFHGLEVIGRLKDGVTPQAAAIELAALIERWRERTGASGHVPTNRPSDADDHSLQLRSMREVVVGDAQRHIWVLQAAVGFVLLIACANLANLFLARAESRRREFSVRAALGASRSRLFRQIVTESLLLAVAGGVIGLALAQATVRTVSRVYATAVPRSDELAIDAAVLLFTVGVSVVTGLLFGLAPLLLRPVTEQLGQALRSGGYKGGSHVGRPRVRAGLVVIEVALTVMLVTAAGLLIRSANQLANVDAGFVRSNLVTFSLTLAEPYDPETRAQAYRRILRGLLAMPGVQSAAFMSGLPPKRSLQAVATGIENYGSSDERAVEVVDYYQFVMGDYFRTMGIPLVAGRGFDGTEVTNARTVVINETLARRVWKDRSPIGERLRPNLGAAIGLAGNQWHTIIGVARDVKQGGVEQPVGTEIYVSLDEIGLAAPTTNAVLRTTMPPPTLGRTIDAVVRGVDANIPVVRLQEMESAFIDAIRRPKFLAQLLGAFAGLALILAVIGIYGVLSYFVIERRRELGIRMALGAHRSRVISLVMKDGLYLTSIGLVLGIVGAFSVSRVIEALLFGVRATDPLTLLSVVAVVMFASAFGCSVPSWRASRLDPNIVLRAE